MGGNTENGSNGKGHGVSNIVISDNGGRVLRAALREAVMTKATPASIGSVNVSGLRYVCCSVRADLAEGVHLVV